MNILAIETSCDDTCVSVLETGKNRLPRLEILSNVVSSQVKIHEKWGGVYPTLAKREHQRNLTTILTQALVEARLLKSKIIPPLSGQKSKMSAVYRQQIKNKKIKEILEREDILCEQLIKFLKNYQKPTTDLVAVTAGPGLEPCLWVGVNFAKTLSYFWDLPIIPINHIEAHIVANLLPQISSKSKIIPLKTGQKSKIIEFPAICLVVSGGHTQLILMREIGKYKILGETRDDAAGECFDKVAKILGLGYPGGPIISQIAKKGNNGYPISIKLPRPMIYQKNYDFSFSGLKTAVLYNFKSQPPKIRESKQYIQEMCAEFQQAIVDVLIYKTLKAAKKHQAKSIILGGGVAANEELRKQFKEKIKKEMPAARYYIPDTKYCTDNAAMVGAAAYFHWPKEKTLWQKIEANANLRLS